MNDESQEQRDSRIRSLWDKLDVQKEGSLDVTALKRGLRKIDHREWSWTLYAANSFGV